MNQQVFDQVRAYIYARLSPNCPDEEHLRPDG